MNIFESTPKRREISHLIRQIDTKRSNIYDLESMIKELLNKPSRPSRTNTKFSKEAIIKSYTDKIQILKNEIEEIEKTIQEVNRLNDIEYNNWKDGILASNILGYVSESIISMEERNSIDNMIKRQRALRLIQEELENIKREDEAKKVKYDIPSDESLLYSIRKTAQAGPKNLTNILKPVLEKAIQDMMIKYNMPQTQENKDKIRDYIYSHTTSRITLGDKSTGSQCINTIGDAALNNDEYSGLLENSCDSAKKKFIMDSSRLDVLDELPRSNARRSKCWLCGLPLGPRDGPNKFRPECEHVLPVALASSFFGIYEAAHKKSYVELDKAIKTGNISRQREIETYLNALAKNYGWAHSSCNAHDKGHFDANKEDPLVNYTLGPDGKSLLNPVSDTYRKIVNGWQGPDGNIIGGIKNRLRDNLLRCLNEEELEEWAENRIKVLEYSYMRTTDSINKGLIELPDVYTLGLIGDYLENVTTQAKNAIEFYQTGSGKNKRKRRLKKKNKKKTIKKKDKEKKRTKKNK